MNNKKEIRARMEVMVNKVNYTSRYTINRSLYDCLGVICDKHLTDEQKRILKRIKADKFSRDIA